MTDTHVAVLLNDGREVKTPISWYPRLVGASEEAREKFEISAFGLHWEDLDEDLSVSGMLAGLGDQTKDSRPESQVPGADSITKVDFSKIGFENGKIDFPDLDARVLNG